MADAQQNSIEEYGTPGLGRETNKRSTATLQLSSGAKQTRSDPGNTLPVESAEFDDRRTSMNNRVVNKNL